MKTFLLTLLFAAAVAASAADDAPLNGKWQVHIKIADHESDATCTFVQSGNALTGTCTSVRGTVNLNGKIDGKKVTWTYKSESEANGTVTLNYRGALNSATEITGFVNVEEFGVEGEFAATRS